MIRMSSQVETVVNAYKQLAKIPSVAGAKLSNGGRTVTSVWSVRNLDRGKLTKFAFSTTLDEDLNVVAESEFGTDVSSELLSAVSPRQLLRAVVREQPERDSKKQYLEVWRRRTLERSVELGALELHGDVYADSEFKSLDWSPDDNSIVYVAERKLPKSEPFIKRKPAKDESKTDSSESPVATKGQEYAYRQDWGEQLVGKHLSAVAVCRLDTETVTVLAGLPDSWCPGQVRWAPDGKSVVGVAWETEPRRLGLIFCTNRPSFIFSLTLDGQYRKISAEGLAVRSPRFIGTDRLVWLQRAAGGPHHACHQLVYTAWPAEGKVHTAVDIVADEVQTSNGRSFHGVYSLGLPERCAAGDGRVLFSTQQRTRIGSYVVDLGTGRLVDISDPSGSTTILDVQDDVVLASRTSLQNPSQLIAAKLPRAGSEHEVRWRVVSAPTELPASVQQCCVEHLDLDSGDGADVSKFSAIYFGPPAGQALKAPLVVWPHGGPHSAFADAYSLEAALFCMLGYACLQINYRGSVGSGENSVQFLPRRVGTSDVEDCRLAAAEALRRFPADPAKLCLFGGSHGGFLAAHLSGQHPEMFACVVTRNPVTDLAAMLGSTDIADCEAGCYSFTKPLGFALVQVNFRGSTGQGDACVRCLPGHVGEYDVRDCLRAMSAVSQNPSVHADNCFLFGKSYGGLVVGHLSGQRPELFRAVVMRCPLLDLAVKAHCADNTESCAVEAGFDFTEAGPSSEEQLLAMRRASPLAHAHRVRAPTALMLGSADRRVPHYQGLDYHRRLRANGCVTELFMYDDNHSLSSLAVEMDNLINSVLWFQRYAE